MTFPLLVVAGAPAYEQQAAEMACQLGLPQGVVGKPVADTLCLFCNEAGWSLRLGNSIVQVDFDSGATTYRRLHGGGRGEMLARAVGVRSGNRIPSVLDATPGLGRDAFVLASVGCHTTMVERSPVVHLLLQDGLQRANQSASPDVAAVVSRLSLLAGDSCEYLANGLPQPVADVIYLDPMFPERGKTAAVKKEMAFFQHFLREDDDADQLLLAALEANPCRVVVKRPRHAPHLANKKPSTTLEGKSTRFDVYALRSLAVS